MNEQFCTESLKIACNLIKVHILSPFKGDGPFTYESLRVLALLRVALRLLINAIQSKGLQHFLIMNLITNPSASLLLQFHLAEKRKNTERFEVHRLKVKLQNESNVNILRLCFFYYPHTHCKF